MTAAVIYAGWLTKSPPITNVDDKTVKSWRKRWFTLTPVVLRYYADEGDTSVKGTIELTGAKIMDKVYSDNKQYVFSIANHGRTYFLQAASSIERCTWVDQLKDAIRGGSPAKTATLAPPKPMAAPPSKPTYSGPTIFHVSYEGQWVRLEVKPTRLDLVRTVNRGRPAVPSDVITDTWPLAGLTKTTYHQREGVFQFVAGQLDARPGHTYQFGLRPRDDIVAAIEGMRGGSGRYSGERAQTVVYRETGLDTGKSAKQLNEEVMMGRR